MSDYDVVVVGAGFAGLQLVHECRKRGLSVHVFERASGVGGTWYWNRYPGARCDVESMWYSYSFSPEIEQEWTWTEKCATQSEILRYLEFVADKLSLRDAITLDTSVTDVVFDDTTALWSVATDSGVTVTSRFVIMATGCLSTGNMPDMPGVHTFHGGSYHTGSWPHDGVDFTGKKVAVIGTGSSGVQMIPLIAQDAEELVVFQRTPNFVVHARNAPLTPEFVTDIKSRYASLRDESRWSNSGKPGRETLPSALDQSESERNARYEAQWEAGGAVITATYADILTNQESNDTLTEFLRKKIRKTVTDPETAERLTPYGFPVGAKRVCVGTDYYETYNRDNVTLVDIRTDPIVAIDPEGIRTEKSKYDFDEIVFATGYDAMTGSLKRINIRGRNSVALKEQWENGPKTYLGLAVNGFPNLFLVTGPGSPSVLSNVVTSIEQHVEFIVDHLVFLDASGFTVSEANDDAQEAWVAHVNDIADSTLFPKANSWYTGANVPGKPRVFMPYVAGVGNYRAICDKVVAAEYEGFTMTRP
ncbi:NAD(P)/FAD-dependent oxidoreductase [Rhodococcus sp. T2V]|uniref:flavin-containing monooxygenase n=1 Tax=Rhodococcus sp. T2V TaxID=3034164 RepID=UPI0023E30506|nr:NAD(P)/FAD-dependent oxidoreductase [Rhodococcus sp. T2V]MDF3309532.1 NAD(P)/FAD-dependent oxidoreductase [Rhodococcus sp. T2V]